MNAMDLYDRILVSLHDAMLDDACWPVAARLIDEACRTKGNMIAFGERRMRPDLQVFFARFCHRGEWRPDWEREYFEDFYASDERIPRWTQVADSQLVHVGDLYTDEEKKTSAAYNDAMRRADARDSLHVRLDGPGDTDIGWLICDPSGKEGWESGQIAMIRRLLPHIRQFVYVRDAVAGADALGATLSQLLDTNSIGVIQLDRRGRVAEANDRARNLLRQRAGLSDGGGFLGAWLPADDANLQAVLARALPPGGTQGVSGSTTIARPSPLPRLVVHVNPVSDGRPGHRNRRVAALVLVVDTASPLRISPDLLAEILGLTPAEGQVAALLSEGKTVRDIAVSTRRQEGAVHWLLHQIYRKHGISRQVDLVRLVLSLSNLPGVRRQEHH